ncbi:MAG: hypothetical protein COA35_009370 [Colwellia sp.]|jgi:hypothetical protein|uniref:hypothetical protein n=1 Tax=Pseudoalteromonas marina TaxID=267375 RepID=UPI000C0CA0E1|nr:hypothetical protein [Pseudoalteromonas marina]MBL1384877.1 hypothetical protein [Colwellia sp.]|tara:strand:+ start:152 stop:718 length:567 start_codon:yes stop_codon:yes gene_type:complete
MGLFNKIKTQASTIGTNISDSTSKLSSDIATSAKENAKLSAIRSEITSIEGQLNIGYKDIGKKYVQNLLANQGENIEVALQEPLSRIEPLLEKKIELEDEAIEIEKKIKDQIIIQEKAIFQKEYDQEKEKLEKAVKLDVLSKEEMEEKLAKARLKLDNFDNIRKLKKQEEMGLITKTELAEKLAVFGA